MSVVAVYDKGWSLRGLAFFVGLGVVCSGLIKPDTFLGGNITTMKEVFNDKHTTIVYNRL